MSIFIFHKCTNINGEMHIEVYYKGAISAHGKGIRGQIMILCTIPIPFELSCDQNTIMLQLNTWIISIHCLITNENEDALGM